MPGFGSGGGLQGIRHRLGMAFSSNLATRPLSPFSPTPSPSEFPALRSRSPRDIPSVTRTSVESSNIRAKRDLIVVSMFWEIEIFFRRKR